MAAQNGIDLLLKIDMNGAGLFETVAGLRSTRMSFNTEPVDVTTIQSTNGWRELLGGAGVKTATISGGGVFKDDGTDERVREIFFDAQIVNFQVVVPDFGIIEGPFEVTGFEYAGTYNGEVTFELSLASAGVLDFSAI